MINDTKQDERANVFEAIYDANVGSYLGMPVYLKNGKMFGTVCAIDPEPYAFTEDEIEAIKRISSIISVILEGATSSKHDLVNDKLMRLEKLALLGQLSAGLAHELRNPMQSVKGFVQLLFQEDENNQFRDIVISELDRMNQLINDFLLATQPTAPKKANYPLNKIVDEVVELFKNEAMLQNIQLSLFNHVPEVVVFVDKAQIKQVLINIFKNALEAAGEGGIVSVQVRTDSREQVIVEVSDTGEGIPVSIIERVGEPFFSTKENGTGLGLAISKTIMREHNGAISFENHEGETKVMISLPMHETVKE
ncbi:ATP-binding protein [Halalkalibacter krulwichiae]|nr:ATP-binding protein [Halalkalibacter krulwichiae]